MFAVKPQTFLDVGERCVYRKLKPGRNDGEAPNRFGTWPALDH